MSEKAVQKEPGKEALKTLKAARKEQIAAVTGRMKEQGRAVQAIKEALAGGELTVPELAAATGLPPTEVLWYVATLKKYGEILEGPKAGSYYRYRLGQPVAQKTEHDPGD
ncbi:MAG: transcriptional regulator [Deltaproteobacteria bacterium]|nr:MAG: transcriptional regulator [Deltaproteobacteria bacterium]